MPPPNTPAKDDAKLIPGQANQPSPVQMWEVIQRLLNDVRNMEREIKWLQGQMVNGHSPSSNNPTYLTTWDNSAQLNRPSTYTVHAPGYQQQKVALQAQQAPVSPPLSSSAIKKLWDAISSQ